LASNWPGEQIVSNCNRISNQTPVRKIESVTSAFQTVIFFALFTMAAAVVGAAIAVVYPPTPVVRSYIQHLAAGVVFSVVAVELLPDITGDMGAFFRVAIGFLLGVTAMLTLKSVSEKWEGAGGELRLGLLAGIGIDVFLDGFLIGIGFAMGVAQGVLLTIALTLELLSLGLAVAVELVEAGRGRLGTIGVTSLLFLLIVVGAGTGALLIQDISTPVLEGILSFGLAALLYLVTEELLAEAHEQPETPGATAMFFLGFLAFLLLGMAGSTG
jgi:ZIP family zinc transporter